MSVPNSGAGLAGLDLAQAQERSLSLFWAALGLSTFVVVVVIVLLTHHPSKAASLRSQAQLAQHSYDIAWNASFKADSKAIASEQSAENANDLTGAKRAEASDSAQWARFIEEVEAIQFPAPMEQDVRALLVAASNAQVYCNAASRESTWTEFNKDLRTINTAAIAVNDADIAITRDLKSILSTG